MGQNGSLYVLTRRALRTTATEDDDEHHDEEHAGDEDGEPGRELSIPANPISDSGTRSGSIGA